MDRRDFLLRVVPWPAADRGGYVNLHFTRPGKGGLPGRPFRDVDGLLALADYACTHPQFMRDIYFCLSQQKNTGKVFNGRVTAARSNKWVNFLKAVWFDIDVKEGKGYASTAEALDALGNFLTATGLPKPTAIVASGSGGLHVYWISQKPLTQDEWYPYALGFDSLARKHGLKIDPITTDSARVLRVPGTYNYKHTPARVCTLLALAPNDYDFAQLDKFRVYEKAVTATVTVKPAAIGPLFDPAIFPKRPIPPGETADYSLETGADRESPPLDWKPIVAGCPHFATTWKDHGKDSPQGLWMLDVLSATFMDDGPAVAHVLSNGYPTYTKDETNAMYERKEAERDALGLGWPSCTAFENAGCSQCAGCPLKGTIRSPLNLGIPAAPQSGPSQTGSSGPAALFLPDGYTVDDDGKVCEVVEVPLTDGDNKTIVAQLFYSVLSDPFCVAGAPGERGLGFYATQDKGAPPRKVLVPEVEMAVDAKVLTTLWRHGCKVFVKNEKRVRHFLSSWMDKLDDLKVRETTVPYGWVDRDGKRVGFAYGGTVSTGGTTYPSGITDPSLEDIFKPTGSPDPWYLAFKTIVDQKRIDLQVQIALAFGSVLMHIPAQYSGVVCSTGDSGAHKSSSIKVGQAVWGQPKKGVENTDASNGGITRKMAFLRDLPLYWDELNSPERLERMIPLIGLFTQGSTGSKMFQDRSLRGQGEWQNLVGIGTNQNLWSAMMKHDKASEANLRRIFQFTVTKREDGLLRQSDATRIFADLDKNYGHAGLKYAQFLGARPDYVEQEGLKILHWFEDQMKPETAERFWMASCAVMLAGASLANEALGINFDLPGLAAFLTKSYYELRRDIVAFAVTMEEPERIKMYLNGFIKNYFGNSLWAKRPGERGRSSREYCHIWREPDQRFANTLVHLRWNTDIGLLQISLQEFQKYLRAQQANEGNVMKGLRQYENATISKGRKNLGAGTAKGASEYAIEIPITPAHELWPTMMEPVAKDDRRLTVAVNNDATQLQQKALAHAQELAMKLTQTDQQEPDGGSTPDQSGS